jgi:hypothetical protein
MSLTNDMNDLPVVTMEQFITQAVAHASEDRLYKRPIILLGEPGGGKTDACKEVCKRLDIQPHEILFKRPGNHTVVDYIGCPDIVRDEGMYGITRFAPQDFVHDLAAGKYKAVIWDEITECMDSVQNLLCGAMYDFDIAGIKLDPSIIQLATGNRASDRAGSRDLVSKMPSRSSMWQLGRSVDNWVAWSIREHLPRWLSAFISWKGEPALYGENGFNPRNMINACPRQWEEVGRVTPELYSPDMYSLKLQSYVPAGLALEAIAFKALCDQLPPIHDIKTKPETTEVPEKIEIVYAIISRLLPDIKKVADFQQFMKYIKRCRIEPQTLFVNAARAQVPEIKECREYNEWAMTNSVYYGAEAA